MPALRAGVHARHPGGHRRRAGAQVHAGGQADDHVARLGLGDFHLRLEPGRVRHAGEVRAGNHPLADLHRHRLEHARHPGADLEGVQLAPA